MNTRGPSNNAKPARRAGIEINAVSDGYVVYDPDRDRVHYLNQTAAFILEFCTGNNTPDDIAASLQSAYHLDQPVNAHVRRCLEQLRTEGLIGTLDG